METIAEQVQKLREEISMHNASMLSGVYVIVALMIAVYAAAVITNKIELYKLVLMVAVTATFFVARQDYMIHRAGSYIRYVESESKLEALREKYPPGPLSQSGETASCISQIQSWENWKNGLKSRLFLLPALDLLAGLVVFYLVACAAMSVWGVDSRFVLISTSGFFLGIAAVPISVLLAGK